jgi:hypothetical protein
MTFRAQCEFSEFFRAISVTGMGLSRAWVPGEESSCRPTRHIPIVGFCGSNDGLCATAGGNSLSLGEQLDFFEQYLGCRSPRFETLRTSTTTCTAVAGCGLESLDTIEFCMVGA